MSACVCELDLVNLARLSGWKATKYQRQ